MEPHVSHMGAQLLDGGRGLKEDTHGCHWKHQAYWLQADTY